MKADVCRGLQIVLYLQRGEETSEIKEEFLKLFSQEPQGEAKRAGLGLRSWLASAQGLLTVQSVEELGVCHPSSR